MDPLVFEASLRWGWGVDGGWMPLPTPLRRYCNPVLLVVIIIVCGRRQSGRNCSRRNIQCCCRRGGFLRHCQ